ncbi:growth arrest-specific protein 2-like isoform X2 [Crassostrea virginica]|uniref:Growth arrest-specific protein 2-like isoform X5 n=1 Tax=Crassostrea virginica TaxID=6565 RepID=A0A8B8ADY6_CRAVI|nr:growth arrest-specific protein 2-like isoform X5 [Crassostrea virginica]
MIMDGKKIKNTMTTVREAGLSRPEAGLDPRMTANGAPKEEEECHVSQKLAVLQEESLKPIKEDLAEWIARTLGIDITTDNFLEVLDNGVHLCNLAKLIQGKAEECVQNGTYDEPLPRVSLKYRNNATSGSWFARDNTANFLKWCKAYGMADDQMFETEYLVSHTGEKSVLMTILELARIGYKFGLDPPNLIKMEKEIEKEEEEVVVEVKPPKPSGLDAEVRRIAFLCKCHDHVKKLGDGKYLIFGKVVQIRFLKNRHLMVRVGGGWDTLENYLIHHRPVEVFEHKRLVVGEPHDIGNKYLYFKSKYRSHAQVASEHNGHAHAH